MSQCNFVYIKEKCLPPPQKKNPENVDTKLLSETENDGVEIWISNLNHLMLDVIFFMHQICHCPLMPG